VSCVLLDFAVRVLWLTLCLFQGGGYGHAQEVMSSSCSDLSTRRLLRLCTRILWRRRSCRYAITNGLHVYRIHVYECTVLTHKFAYGPSISYSFITIRICECPRACTHSEIGQPSKHHSSAFQPQKSMCSYHEL
jgi:hypothetical protein